MTLVAQVNDYNVYLNSEVILISGNGGCIGIPRYQDLTTGRLSAKLDFPLDWDSITPYLV